MAVNVELRRKVGGSFTDTNSILYPKTLPTNVIGLIGTGGKIEETLLPGSVFGGMRFVNTISGTAETGYVGDVTGLADAIDSYISANGGTASGLYFIASAETTVQAPTDQTFANAQGANSEEEGVQGTGPYTVTLEPNDWLVCRGVGPSNEYLFSVVNNTYRLADANHPGLMTSADHDKLAGIEAEANKYIHPTHEARSADTSGVTVLDTLQSDSLGHVTALTTRTLPSATVSTSGVVELAEGTELTTNLSSANVPSALSAKNMIDYFTGNKLYTDTASANNGEHPDGSIVFVQTT